MNWFTDIVDTFTSNIPPVPVAYDEYNLSKCISKEANKKSWELFWTHLNEVQKHQMLQYRKINVIAEKSKRVFVLNTQHINNNVGRREEIGFHLYCLVPEDNSIPVWDIFLIQKLLLEADEDYFFRIAARTVYNAHFVSIGWLNVLNQLFSLPDNTKEAHKR